jgi:hypothetical protein
VAAISERFELESSDWAHFLSLFELFPDITRINRRRTLKPDLNGPRRRAESISNSDQDKITAQTYLFSLLSFLSNSCFTLKQNKTKQYKNKDASKSEEAR